MITEKIKKVVGCLSFIFITIKVKWIAVVDINNTI